MTYLTKEVLERIEAVSDIKWADDTPPTSFDPRVPAMLFLEDNVIVHSSDAGLQERPVELKTTDDFVTLCSEICPKGE